MILPHMILPPSVVEILVALCCFSQLATFNLQRATSCHRIPLCPLRNLQTSRLSNLSTCTYTLSAMARGTAVAGFASAVGIGPWPTSCYGTSDCHSEPSKA